MSFFSENIGLLRKNSIKYLFAIYKTGEVGKMSVFQTMLNLQLSLFAIMLIGFFCRRKNLIDEKTRGVLSDLLINIILPCNILGSFRMEVTDELLRSAGMVFAVLTIKAG